MEEDWKPPTAEQLERFERDRERSNKISKIMGDYLLKGYKMLGTTCNKCQAILLRDRQGEDFCVGCVEVDNCTSDVAQVNSLKPRTDFGETHRKLMGGNFVSSAEQNNNSVSPNRQISGNETGYQIKEKDVLEQSITSIFRQIQWANECLNHQDINLEQREKLVNFVGNCHSIVLNLIKNR